MASDIGQRTIRDFGDQWSRYPDNSGFFGSHELFRDIVEPLICESNLEGMVVAEIGSGAGRVVNMLCRTGVRRVYAVEPSSAAFSVLRKNVAAHGSRVECLNLRGDELPDNLNLDYVFAIGVVQFIPSPDATVRAAFKALNSGGKCFFWLYGKEGNETYLGIVLPLRRITVSLPHFALALLCHGLNVFLDIYIQLCRLMALPMRDYVLNVISCLSREKRYLTIYDQLNPTYARYYTEAEARDLLARGGFTDIKLYHRHGYSWSVLGTRS